MPSKPNNTMEGLVQPINLPLKQINQPGDLYKPTIAERLYYSIGHLSIRVIIKTMLNGVFILLLLFFTLYLVYPPFREYADRKLKKSKSYKPEGFYGECFAQQENFSSKKESFTKIKIGSHTYKVHEDLENPQGAAETMDKLNTAAKQLIEHLEQKYLSKKTELGIKQEYVKRVIEGVQSMKKNFKTANLEENIPERSGGDTSYVINKGDVFAMCLRDPKNDHKLDPKFNTLSFVLIHELAHLFSSTYGHDDIFWNNFKFLLQEAELVGLYEAVNYKRDGSPYCGIVVTYSPLYDNKLVNYYISK